MALDVLLEDECYGPLKVVQGDCQALLKVMLSRALHACS